MIPKPGFILFVMVLLFAQPSQGEGVSWNISPRLSDKSVTGLSLSLTFPGDDDGTTDLALPDEWGGEKQLHLGLGAVEATGARVLPGATPAQLRLAHSPGAQVTLTWQGEGEPPELASAQSFPDLASGPADSALGVAGETDPPPSEDDDEEELDGEDPDPNDPFGD